VTPTAFYGLLLAVSVLGVALALGGWQWAAHRGHPNASAEDEATHFARQNLRRSAGAAIMTLLAALIFVGSRIEHLGVNGRPNPAFIVIWLTTFALVVLLLILALIDWVSIQRYARRQRSAIVREGLETLQDELRRQHRGAADGNGRATE
jgi:hypothetical protein